MKGRKPGLFVNFGQFPCSWIRIRIPNTDADPGGSGSTTLEYRKHADSACCRRLEGRAWGAARRWAERRGWSRTGNRKSRPETDLSHKPLPCNWKRLHSVVDLHWFQCGSKFGSLISGQCRSKGNISAEKSSYFCDQNFIFTYPLASTSVGDPVPGVFGPPGFGSGSLVRGMDPDPDPSLFSYKCWADWINACKIKF